MKKWLALLGGLFVGVAVVALIAWAFAGSAKDQATIKRPVPPTHLDHAAFFQKPFEKPQDVTLACLKCHETAAKDMMKTAHWQWLGEPVKVPGHEGEHRIGKKNLLNNFCIGIEGNWPSCTRCHAGYGWEDNSFDFEKQENVDCLACHDWSGTYRKGKSGLPEKDVDLLASAKSVGYPKRQNCGLCHFYGGGGLGVKHGDLDNSLENGSSLVDVHMGREKFLCVDCHQTTKHNIPGKAFSVSVNHDNGMNCTDCHQGTPHKDERLNRHMSAVACQTCHIPTFANKVPTKMDWDWSKAGDDTRKDDVHHYLKIKGEFVYEESVKPEYAWFNLTVDRYLLGDKINPAKPVLLNNPRGDIHDKAAKIWPFKIHRGKQPYDVEHRYLSPVVTAGKGGFWWEFNWDQALRLGAELAGLPYSGKYDFAHTEMFWPLSHMVQPKERALACTDCHGEGGRMNWSALGYANDPILTVRASMNTKSITRLSLVLFFACALAGRAYAQTALQQAIPVDEQGKVPTSQEEPSKSQGYPTLWEALIHPAPGDACGFAAQE